MHITLFKSGKIPIPPQGYGGTERHIYWVGQKLVELGHQVTLVANAKSHVPGVELRPIPAEMEPFAALQLIPKETDIVHFHEKPPGPIDLPYLMTSHGNGQPGETFPLNTLFVSRRHAANHGSAHYVYPGVIPEEYTFSKQREDFALFVAKARWKVKNFQGSINVARRAKLELRVIGSRNLPFSLQRCLPAIRGVRYFGTADEATKRDLLSRARCLIFPVRWEEPFGLSITEALVSGCYVVGTPYGALPEIITPEVGRLSTNATDLAEAVSDPKKYGPVACRNRVMQGGFTLADCVNSYVRCYERILSHGLLGELGEPAPMTKPGFVSKQLLPWED